MPVHGLFRYLSDRKSLPKLAFGPFTTASMRLPSALYLIPVTSFAFSSCQPNPLHGLQDGRLLVINHAFIPEEISHLRLYPDSVVVFFPAARSACYEVKRYHLRREGDTLVMKRLGIEGAREQRTGFRRVRDSLFLGDADVQLPAFTPDPENPTLPVCD